LSTILKGSVFWAVIGSPSNLLRAAARVASHGMPAASLLVWASTKENPAVKTATVPRSTQYRFILTFELIAAMRILDGAQRNQFAAKQ
jgi:hypothetical protein